MDNKQKLPGVREEVEAEFEHRKVDPNQIASEIAKEITEEQGNTEDDRLIPLTSENQEICPNCDGTKTDPMDNNYPCAHCNGFGVVETEEEAEDTSDFYSED